MFCPYKIDKVYTRYIEKTEITRGSTFITED